MRRSILRFALPAAIAAALLMLTLGRAVIDAGAHERVVPSAHRHCASMNMSRMAMGTPGSGHSISVASLIGPQSATHMRTFTLVARPARLSLGRGIAVDAWTYNGQAPGPVLRVRQGDLVVVHLVNHLPVATTIHWHGIILPNGEDGVAGSTQDAVPPGHTYTYRFIATLPGTYWYHAHQDSLTQVARGLYGALVVAPAARAPHDDADAPLVLHSWQVGAQDVRVVGSSTGATRIAARPGAWVRLRLINTDSVTHLVTPIGAPFTVVALDGHDLHGPQSLIAAQLPVGAGQRYDVRFRMPVGDAVAVYVADLADEQHLSQRANSRLSAIVGAGAIPAEPRVSAPWFNLTTYGTPQPAALAPFRHADVTYTLRLGVRIGASFLNQTHYTINDLAAPDTAPIIVKRGQVVRLRIVNDTLYIHPIHLHGHAFVVLTRNGRPLHGSPIALDTLNVYPHETYEIAFRADNPGIWMLHCHNLTHARLGMSMMVMYEGVTTPFMSGGPAGNIPD